jgi:cell division protein FtsA
VRREPFVAGIDVGTTKICTVIGRPTPRGLLEVLGVGIYPSNGLRRGVVVDREVTVHSIRESVAAAERMADVKIAGAYVGITGDHIQCANVTGRIRTGVTGEVTPEDVEKVIQSARDSVSLPSDRQVVHTIVRDFVLDGQTGVKRPVGMSATHLDAEVHVVTGMASMIENVEKCLFDCDLEVQQRVLEPIATGHAVLTEVERDLGVILVDIGGGTTDIAAFENGSICHSSAIPVAGNHITRDIARVLHISIEDAESLKCRFGRAVAEMASAEDFVQINLAGTGEAERIPQKLISEIIEPRIEEIFTLVKSDLRRAGVYKSINGGVVISGGGAQMSEASRLASTVLDDLPVRVGSPRGLVGLAESVGTPMHATGVGLAIQAAQEGADAAISRLSEGFTMRDLMRRARAWWDDVAPRVQRAAQHIRRP